jgi:hypothetical protein
MIADHVTGQPTRIAVPVLIDVLTAYLIDALRRGYTHSIGSPTINMQLSQWRANAVRRALVYAGVDPAMLSEKGYGSSHSLASKNGTVEGRSNSIQSRVIWTPSLSSSFSQFFTRRSRSSFIFTKSR